MVIFFEFLNLRSESKVSLVVGFCRVFKVFSKGFGSVYIDDGFETLESSKFVVRVDGF